MATNPARNRAPLVLERLEEREVPAAYSWDASLIAQLYPAASPPPPVAGVSGADYRLASNGSAGQAPGDGPAAPVTPTVSRSAVLELSDDAASAGLPPPASPMPDRNFLQAGGGVADGPSTNDGTTGPSGGLIGDSPPTGIADATVV